MITRQCRIYRFRDFESRGFEGLETGYDSFMMLIFWNF